MIDGLYEAVSEPDVAGSCTRSFLCGHDFPLIPILLTVIGFVAGFMICRTVSAYLCERRLKLKYEIIKTACAQSLRMVAEGRHEDAFNLLIRRITAELPAIAHPMMISGAPVGAKTTADYLNTYMPRNNNSPLGVAFAELFSAEFMPVNTNNPTNLVRVPKVLEIRMHTLAGCHPVDAKQFKMGFEAVEVNYPVLRPNEMAPLTHTPAVIPPQILEARDERKFLRLIGQTTVMITVDLDGLPQEMRPSTPVVCSCGAGQLRRLFPGPSNTYPVVDYTDRNNDEKNKWIHQAISDFQKSWNAPIGNNNDPAARGVPAGLYYMKQMAETLN